MCVCVCDTSELSTVRRRRVHVLCIESSLCVSLFVRKSVCVCVCALLFQIVNSVDCILFLFLILVGPHSLVASSVSVGPSTGEQSMSVSSRVSGPSLSQSLPRAAFSHQNNFQSLSPSISFDSTLLARILFYILFSRLNAR